MPPALTEARLDSDTARLGRILAGFVEETLSDPPVDWPALVRRASHLASGAYATFPTEEEIRTDIPLFQYAKDVAAAAQTFVFGVPPAFEVSISSTSNQSFVVGTPPRSPRPRST